MTVATTWQKNMGRGLCEGKTENSFYLVIITDVRNLHVVANLEIVGELQGLSHGDVTPGLEHHHSDGLAGEQVTDDQLSDDVQTDLLVSDSLDHTDRNRVDKGYARRQRQRIRHNEERTYR